MKNDQQTDEGDYPFALFPGMVTVAGDDRLILVLRDGAWGEKSVQELIDGLKEIGLGGRFAILYLGENDEAHVIRGKSA